jgi:hypothetical protein
MLSDRKSESYALKWCDIDFKHSQIIIGKALNKFGEEKNPKGIKQLSLIFHLILQLYY